MSGEADTIIRRYLDEFASFARQYLDAAGRRDSERVTDLTRALNAAVTEAVNARDFGAMAALGSRIARLRRNLLAVTESVDAAPTSLALMLDTLDSRAIALSEIISEGDCAEMRALRDRVLALVRAGTGRPTTLAEQLGVDPVQVSRVLRGLVQDGAVEQSSPPPELAGDRRIRWYRAVLPERDDSVIAVSDADGSVEVTIRGALVGGGDA